MSMPLYRRMEPQAVDLSSAGHSEALASVVRDGASPLVSWARGGCGLWEEMESGLSTGSDSKEGE
jgi:hypothetical protein